MSMQSKDITLKEVKPGTTVRVAGFSGIKPGLLRRLFELGLTSGSEIRVCGTAPLGDPLILQVRGCRIALRKQDACGINVIVP